MEDKSVAGYLEIPKPIQLPEDTEMTDELLATLVEIHSARLERYKILDNYYRGKAKILDREKDEHKANNKVILDYPGYIVDVLLGMFIGNPVNYATSEDNQEKLDAVQEVFDLNDEQDENTELGKMMGVLGLAYELVYLDEEGNVRFNEIKPDNVLMVYDNKITPEPLFALYIRELVTAENLAEEDKDLLVTVYDRTNYTTYQGKEEFTVVDSGMHMFDEVPIVEFPNNDEMIGDFERVLSQIDAMNKIQSDTANDFEEFTDAILLLYGMMNTDAEDFKAMRDAGAILLDNTTGGEQGAEWLVKNINDSALENYKRRLDEDIHKFSKVPNMGDTNFSGNVSGESLKYKLLAMDQVIVQKQRKFKRGLQKRLKLIMSILNIKTDGDFKHTDISISFKDNKPYDELANIQTVASALQAGMSREYAFAKLKDLDSVSEELERQDQMLMGMYPFEDDTDDEEDTEELQEVDTKDTKETE